MWYYPRKLPDHKEISNSRLISYLSDPSRFGRVPLAEPRRVAEIYLLLGEVKERFRNLPPILQNSILRFIWRKEAVAIFKRLSLGGFSLNALLHFETMDLDVAHQMTALRTKDLPHQHCHHYHHSKNHETRYEDRLRSGPEKSPEKSLENSPKNSLENSPKNRLGNSNKSSNGNSHESSHENDRDNSHDNSRKNNYVNNWLEEVRKGVQLPWVYIGLPRAVKPEGRNKLPWKNKIIPKFPPYRSTLLWRQSYKIYAWEVDFLSLGYGINYAKEYEIDEVFINRLYSYYGRVEIKKREMPNPWYHYQVQTKRVNGFELPADMMHDPRLPRIVAKIVNQYWEDPLLKAALVHALFNSYPFTFTVNWRVPDTILPVLLYNFRLIPEPVFCFNDIVWRHRKEYDRALNKAKKGEVKEWIDFFIEAVVQSVRKFSLVIDNLEELYRTETDSITRLKSKYSQDLLDLLFLQPYVGSEMIPRLLKHLRFQTLYNLLKKFETAGMISETAGRSRNRIYSYHALIRLLRYDHLLAR